MADDDLTDPRPVRGDRVTLRDIADELGVSAMTVSNAFNRPDQLSSATRDRVLATARRLGFAGPNPTARGLRRGRTGAIGVIYDSHLSYAFTDPAAVALLGGLAEVAEARGLGLLLVPGSTPADRSAQGVADAMIDGVVIYSVADGDPAVAAAVRRALPAVVVDQPELDGVPLVGIDDAAAAEAVARHVLDRGHRRLAVVMFGLARDGHAGPIDGARRRASIYRVSRARLEGYAAAVATAGIAWADVQVVECPGSSTQLGREAATKLLAGLDRPTAVLAASDQLALGVLDAAAARGLAVPDDLAVAGFDDIPAAATAPVPLTSVRQDHHAKGEAAARLLCAQLDGEAVTSPPPTPATVVARASTGGR